MTGSRALHVSDVGSTGPRVVFLHGLFGQGKNFSTIARALEPQWRSLLVDLPNHGASPWTEHVDYVAMADAVAATLREHGESGADGGTVPDDGALPDGGTVPDDGALPDGEALPDGGSLPDDDSPPGGAARQTAPVHVVGHSMGGKVAMLLALRHPELVDRLVVVDIAPSAAGETGEFEHLLDSLAALDLDQVTSRAGADAALAGPIPNPTVRGFLLQNLRRAEDGGWRWRANLDLLRKELDVISGFPDPDGVTSDGTAQLDGTAQFDGPVLWVAGERSNYIRPENAPAMRALFPRVRQLTVKGAGHWVHSEQPEVFTQALRVFLGTPV